MDPASAIGVAAATVQFFAIGIKAISLGKQICASKTGSTEANDALEKSLKAISDIRKDLRHDIIRDANSNIAKAQKQCLDIAETLLKVLESIKASSQTVKSKFLKDVSATWQVMRARSKIDKLEQELGVAQNHFKEALTVETRNAVAQVLESQGKDTTMLQTLWNEIQKLHPELQQARKENSTAHERTLVSVTQIERTFAAQHAITQSSHQATLGAIEDLGISVQAQFKDKHETDIHRDILETLRYPDMLHRQQEISPPTAGTYEWIFTGESPYHDDPAKGQRFLSVDVERRQKLLRWFSSDQSLFWINGKPGSGKSSLMSFIANDQRTLQALRSGAGQQYMQIIKFFFWRPGSPMQRSVSGLLRSLLYQILIIDTSVINRLVANKSIRRHPTWEQVELLRTLELVLERHCKGRFCFFIDGLDEHDGDYMSLLQLILQPHITNSVKICISSRLEPAFRLCLSLYPSISMQDLNEIDIKTLVRQKLELTGPILASLVDEVTRRAEGVILWAALVCNSLLRGYTTYDDEFMIWKRLSETPSGLKELFRHMFSKIDKIHREHLRVYCYLLHWSSRKYYETHYTSLSLVTVMVQNTDIESQCQFAKLCATCKERVVGQSQGLIEISVQGQTGWSEKRLWSLREAADQRGSRSQSQTLNKKLYEYSRLHIRWVHRSAHDCIFGEPGETIAPWIGITDDAELKRKAVRCLSWLARHSPMIGIWEYADGGRGLHTRLDDLVQDIIALTTYDEAYNIIEELHDLTVLSFPGHDRRCCRAKLQDAGANDWKISLELQPLLSLWEGVRYSGQYSYFDRLADKSFAAVICSRLINTALAIHDEATMCRFLDHISQDIQFRTAGQTVYDDFLHSRQFSSPVHKRHVTSRLGNPIVLTWQGKGDHDEIDIMHGLAALLSPRIGHSPERSWSQVLALMATRDVWRGPQAVDQRHALLPLHFLLPNSAFLQWWMSSQPWSSPLTSGFPSTFRLICMHPNRWKSGTKLLQRRRMASKETMVAVFDLSVTATTCLLSQSISWTSLDNMSQFYTVAYALKMTWVSTKADYSACLKAIIDDIWANRDEQLDAWQQLYALTCVKLYLRRMWKIADQAKVAKWIESDYSGSDNASVSDSGSDEQSESEQ
jgi:hypothetical protein